MTTAYNQSGTFTASNANSGILLFDTANHNVSGSNFYEGVVGAYPGTPFTRTVLMSVPINIGSDDSLGVVIANTTVGTNMVVQLFYNSGFHGYVIGQPVPNGGGTQTVISTLGALNVAPAFIWFQVIDDGTNITMQMSTDGEYYPFTYTVAKASSYLGAGAFNFIGAVVSPTNDPVGSVVMSWQ